MLFNIIYNDFGLETVNIDEAFKNGYNNNKCVAIECFLDDYYFYLVKLKLDPFTTVWINRTDQADMTNIKTLHNLEEKTGSEWKSILQNLTH